MASFINNISASPPSYHTPLLQFNGTPSLVHFKSGWGRRSLLFRMNCMSEESSGDTGEDSVLKTKTTSEKPPVKPPFSASNGSAISEYNWCAGLGTIGFLETSYLTYIKLTNSDAFCPVGSGGACGSVLNSEYSVVFGIPLPLIGMVAYGVVAMLGLQLGGNKLPFEIGRTTSRSILLVTTTSMAVASAYFLYILSTQFAGESCLYCLASALLSFSLFFISIKDLGSKEIQKEVILPLCIAGLVVTALSASYSTSQPISTSLDNTELPFFKTEVTRESSPLAVALAKHLRSIGAKMYGAFWCSHCQEQKEMFGREAAEILDYVECFPDGYRKGIQIAKACTDVKIEGFPTWVINGQPDKYGAGIWHNALNIICVITWIREMIFAFGDLLVTISSDENLKKGNGRSYEAVPWVLVFLSYTRKKKKKAPSRLYYKHIIAGTLFRWMVTGVGTLCRY